ncbi:MAG: TIGR01777 family oxidoreductase [Akkermansiaceae bacterium]|nr:TIGR01777 family oxidoreductase [Akkermansiaceae bacterium]MDP4645662.1 TIGR01777 family oxidoreductase [Akkermansiaceae bacterium]MDP4719909.1 TIGR01777 family oxidoreductase [Akkermansiaceae bacterium]MDP4778770.1 TIGR01777 family oxidoreductase [Akkermansiaceae bacterium]MDP4847027.1 TIGR01777 family oxidoreductase [Akkermansiaceae bacterium]
MNSTVVIIGANGFLGRYLSRHFARTGREVVAIARNKKGWSGDGMFLAWDGKTIGPWAYAMEGAELVINLAGKSVNCRYNEENRKALVNSRVETTELIGRAIAECRVPPKLWINASTATWYRHAEDKPQDEWNGEPGKGFSCDVAQAWEDAFFGAKIPAETRKVAMRIGMVLANEPETVYDVLTGLTNKALGGTMGGGQQRISWIHMEDFLRAVDFVVRDPFMDGIVNVTAPDHPTNREYMRYFRETVGMPIGLPAAKWMLAIGAAFMDTETELVLKSRWAEPLRLREAGFRWRYAKAADAIGDLESRQGLKGFFRESERRSTGARAWVPAATR